MIVRPRILVGSVAALAAAVIGLFGGLVAGGGGGTRAGAAAPAAGDSAILRQLLVGLSGNDTAAYVDKLEGRLRRRPHDGNVLLLLGLAYQQRARETGDPRFYSLSELALRRAQLSRANSGLASTGLASLAVSRHRFAAALELARTALRADPKDATAYGARGDAELNVGRYREAFAAYDRMAELSPGVASYGRIAHARELEGRPRAAEEALDLALTLDTSVPEYRAAALVQLGNLRFNVGRMAAARTAYARALTARPGYVHAQVGLARVDAARGRYGRAASLLRGVVERLPLPQYAIWHGDVLRAAGRRAEAATAYAVVDAIERVQEANGVRTELQTALFDLDHGRNLDDALARARTAYARAPGLDAADALAWALQRTGRCGEARTYSGQALRLGTLDALKFFHRGMIERCLGDRAAARAWFRRALAVNPSFSLLWAPVARRGAR